MAPQTRYTHSGDVSIAYQVFGSGTLDLVFVPGWISNIEMTAGDGFYATFDGPARAMRCAIAVRDRVRQLGLEIRAGAHTGEVLASSAVRDLTAGSGLRFDDRGTHALKGVGGEWRLFAAS